MTANESEAITAQESGGIAIEPDDLALEVQGCLGELSSLHDSLTMPILGSSDETPEVRQYTIVEARSQMRQLELLLREIERSGEIRIVK